MYVERDTGPFVVLDDEPVELALRKISLNKHRVVFVVEHSGALVGSLSDGDFRRWLVSAESPALDSPARDVANRNSVSVPEGFAATEVNALLAGAISAIPVVDGLRRVVAIALPRGRGFKIEGRAIAADEPTFVIAEIGINHNGDLDTAKRLVDAAAEAGADCAKFQMRDMSALYRVSDAGLHGEDLGAQYTLDLLAESSLTNEEMFAALDYTRSAGLVPLCTPWDVPTAQALEEYGLPAFKVASADLTNHELLAALTQMGRPLIVSTGMSTEAEVIESVELLRTGPAAFALLHSNSAYPAPFKDVNLRYMNRLRDIGDCLVGYSGHERGHHIAVAAVARGARILEKHITLDREGRGNDHRVSLEPAEFAEMVRQIRDVESALGDDGPRTLTQGESLNRLSLAKSLVAARPLSRGQVVGAQDIAVRSPGRGLQPNSRQRLMGTRLTRDVAAGDFFYETDLGRSLGPRDFTFDRPWGLPVRFHDFAELMGKCNPDFLEFHLSYRDLEVDPATAVPDVLDLDFTVHSPDLFGDDHLLDLASDDPAARQRSIDDLQRVIDLTRALKPKFSRSDRPVVIVSVGGASLHGFVSRDERQRLYERCAESLAKVDAEGVELTAQTLPPFPWHVGGQRYWNLFVDPQETFDFCSEIGMRVTLDTSHTKLATNYSGQSFAAAMDLLLPISAHMHIADGTGVDGEGVQVQEGDIDWPDLVRRIDELAPGVGFIPEIWQGHVAGGEGFWVALTRLEALFEGDGE